MAKSAKVALVFSILSSVLTASVQAEPFYGAVGDIDWDGPLSGDIATFPNDSETTGVVCNIDVGDVVTLFSAPNSSSEAAREIGRNAHLTVLFKHSDSEWAQVVRSERVYDEEGYQLDERKVIDGVSGLWVQGQHLCKWMEWS